MSYATGYSYLFVRCKNAKQCEYHKCIQKNYNQHRQDK